MFVFLYVFMLVFMFVLVFMSVLMLMFVVMIVFFSDHGLYLIPKQPVNMNTSELGCMAAEVAVEHLLRLGLNLGLRLGLGLAVVLRLGI